MNPSHAADPATARYAEVVHAMSARQARAGMKLGLDRIRALLDALGSPDHAFRSVLVAGTNGKGSTCAFAASLLAARGLRTGLYTSPHLCRFTERIQVDGVEVSRADVVTLHDRVLAAAARAGVEPTFFEMATAMGLLHFAESRVDVAVLEVGMGGRLDATNAARVDACAITPVDLDHQAFLGNTRALIAGEKAGILRAGIPAVVAPQEPDALEVIRARAREVGAPLRVLTAGDALDVPLGLSGPHQPMNAALAVALVQALGVDVPLQDRSVAAALQSTRWPGRYEWLDLPGGHWLLDGAHNPHGARALAQALSADARVKAAPRRAWVMGLSGDRRAEAVLQPLLDAGLVPDAVVTLQAAVGTAVPAEAVAAQVRAMGLQHVTACASLESALETARERAGPGGLVVVFGSLYALGAVRARLCDQPEDPAPLSG